MKVYCSNLCVGPQFIRAPLSVTGRAPVMVARGIQTLFNSVSFNRPELEELTKCIKMDPKRQQQHRHGVSFRPTTCL